MNSSLWLFPPESKYIELELRSEELQGAHEVGGRAQGAGGPPPLWLGCGLLGLDLLPVFFIISKKTSVEFQVIPRTFVSAHK